MTGEEVKAEAVKLMVLTYKYRLKDRRAKRALSAHAYACNQVWNWAAAQQRDIQARHRAGAPKRKWPTPYDLSRQCKGVGPMLGIRQQTVGVVLDQFAKCRDRMKGCPQYRASFGAKRATGWIPFSSQDRRVVGNTVSYAGMTYRYFGAKRRPLPETVKGGAFVEDALGRWWVTFHVEVANDGVATSGEIGIDLGLKALATTSAGEVIENPRHLRSYAERLAVAQRAGNKRRAAQIHMRIANTRRDFHHKLSTRLAREHAFIAVGNVNSKRLARTRMAKSVLDAGWSAFRTMLAYKAATFVEVDERFTTQTCSSCGALPPERPRGIAGLGVRAWDCSACGASHDRDVNAARNILRLGLSAQPHADGSRGIAA